ncbi:MAG: protein kinase [Myxococcales bacterium]|nr:protein kinase [Myxococcales bacterium]MCB9580898.1 protein kinase [Polyangiaceae bacterium]
MSPAEALIALTRLTDANERRASWRQAVAALGQSVRVTGPPPLDGIAPERLVLAVRHALEQGLADDLDWIAPSSAVVALYELTIALPAGAERRDLGRRVFSRLYEGTASTFAAVAARMALGSGKPLEAATMRARVGLVLDLPVGTSVDADALAYSLVARRELAERWVVRPSVGALPARRLAAKLLEHAAREAVQRAQLGDTLPRDLLAGEIVRPVRKQLLDDREPLVWRHAAVARGLLASVDPRLQEQIELSLDENLSPTEWRRAAVSLVASMAGNPSAATKACNRLLNSAVTKRDPGIFATMVWGLPRVVEVEPDAAEELLDRLSATRRPDVAEAVAMLLSDLVHGTFGQRAATLLRAILASKLDTETPALRGITHRALMILDRDRDHEDRLEERVRQALVAYETTGARAAHELATEAMGRAHATMERIAALSAHDEETLPELVEHLSDVDMAVLERSRLSDLLLLGRRPGDADASVAELEQLQDRLGDWLLDAEQASLSAPWTRTGSVANSRRLRALLHLVDVETTKSEAEATSSRVRARLRRAMQVLLERLAAGPDASVHRILCATLARTFDAAVREGVAEPADVLLLVAAHLTDRQSVATISEASTHLEVQGTVAAYAAFVDVQGFAMPDSLAEGSYDTGSLRREDAADVARRVLRLSRGLAAGGTHRAEALRMAVLRLGRGLEAVAAARGMMDLVSDSASEQSALSDLETAADSLRQLASSVLRRVLDAEPDESIVVSTDVAALSSLVERAVSAGVPPNPRQVSMAIAELTAELPEPIARAASAVLTRLDGLPIEAASDVQAIPLERRRAALPDWLLPRRTIGAFYVVRALGSGGGSSVFVARRLEERHDPNAEAFALKVPQYDPTTARSLSEQEFMQLFREEATALLALPPHENLARFVTFDLAARPKPILVMELIRGSALDRLIRSQSLTTERAFRYLDGILAGLSAMHEAGVGHLDVKPSNVILRDGDMPVLVDFGLSGRQLRPGCGTVEYCAPEVLGVEPEDHVPTPWAADVYSFAAMAFEVLTADLLFDGADEMAMATLHVAHDGWPEKLAALARAPGLGDLGVVLAACLRHDPRNRADVARLRPALASVGQNLAGRPWPLGAGEATDKSA